MGSNTSSPTPRSITVSLALVLGAGFWDVRSATLVVTGRPGSTYPTIQSAVDAAVPGQDDVLVLCGSYQGNVTMRDGVDVRGQSARCTSLRGLASAHAPTVTFPPLATLTELSGFTIQADAVHAAVSGESGPLVISANVLESSQFGVILGGAETLDASIVRNVVRGNYEGGIKAETPSSASTLRITSNLVIGSGLGVEVQNDAGSLLIANNTIVRNSAGGIAVYSAAGENVTIANNVAAWNENSDGILFDGLGQPQLVNNDAWSNTPADFYLPTGSPDPSNFSEDPSFVNEVPNFVGFEPRSNSRLVDGAQPSFAPPTDLHGVPRVSGAACYAHLPDVGARENEGITGVRFLNRADMLWDPFRPSLCGFGYMEYQVLRGDMAALRATGIYRQDPAQVATAARWCETWFGFSDPALPEAGRVFFYFVTGWSECETPFGFTSEGLLREGYVCWGSCPVGPGS